MTFHWNSNGKIKKHISFRLQKDRTYEVAMRNRIHDSVIDLAVQCNVCGAGVGATAVCAEFLGLEKSVRGESTVVSAHYDKRLWSRLPFVWLKCSVNIFKSR